MIPGGRGFTYLELLMVMVVISMMAAVTVPAYSDYKYRTQVMEGLILAKPIQKNIARFFAWHGNLPATNQSLALPPGEQMAGNYVQRITVVQGVIQIEYGNAAAPPIQGKLLTLHPRVERPQVMAWICGGKSTTLESQYLPGGCKS